MSEHMMAELREAGIAFDEDEMPPGLWLNMNDTFGYACADAELVPPDAIPTVYALWKRHGWEGVAWWVWRQRGTPPIPPVRERVELKMEETPLGARLQSLLQASQSVHFEDGMESDFSKELVRLVRQYGKAAMGEIAAVVVDPVDAEIAAEALRWIGRVDHPPSRQERLSLLERCLSSPSILVRDGAALGLAALDDPRALPSLQEAIDRETYPALREDLEQVRDQLREKGASS